MSNFFDLFLQNSITFFAIMDPIGVSALVLSLVSANITKQEMNKVAYKATLTIIIAFIVVLITGDFVLKLFGIDQHSIKVMGGVVLFLTALQMVNSKTKKQTKEEEKEAKEQEDLSVIPIGIPITFGPGLFTTIIIFKQEAHTVTDISALVVAFLVNALIIYLAFKYSFYIKKYMGVTGQNIITKLMGLIVGAIAVQFVVSGLVNLSKAYLGA
ncbi:MarC family protein [Poseidonibacter lekithochrous]|uniref:MarC family protein n=1 Tax=Poseidonibacter lekithochrous TaxID=1904463 RepID=UPI0008FC6DCF|nr:MarC family protein [Poseidonibacter lekithochrous]QKJ24209.1 MarC family membrane protein [Poseidonibacter lekithochrous]